MTDLPTDTHPDAERVWIDLLRQVLTWRKIELMCRLKQMARTPALSGLRERHPDAPEAESKRRLAEKACGPLPQPGADTVE